MRVFDNYIIIIPDSEPHQYKTVRIRDIPEHVYREVLTIGMKQYAYKIGLTKPHYPVPVVSHSDPTLRAIVDPSQWFTNGDDWWRQCGD